MPTPTMLSPCCCLSFQSFLRCPCSRPLVPTGMAINLRSLAQRLHSGSRVAQIQAANRLQAELPWAPHRVDPSHQAALHQAGILPALVGLVGSRHAAVQLAAMSALRDCLPFCDTANKAAVAAAGIVAALFARMADSSRSDVRHRALHTLGDFVLGSSPAARAGAAECVLAAGGIEKLQAFLVDSQDQAAQAAAATALGKLARTSPAAAAAVVAAGGIDKLVAFLMDSGNEPAAFALGSLAGASPPAAAAIAARPGCLPALMHMLGDMQPNSAHPAIFALSRMAGSPDARRLIAASGGVGALVRALASSLAAPLRANAAAALVPFAADSPEHCDAIVAAGCTPS